MSTMYLFPAAPVDAGTVTRLELLDEVEPLAQPVLLAVADGRAVAALSVADGRVAADPFTRSEEAVAMLRLRAGQKPGSARRRRGLLRLRLAA